MRNFMILLSVLLIYGCSSTKDIETEAQESPAKDLYEEANVAFEKGSYKYAAGKFDDLERLHPYSEYASTAQLMAGYSYYNAQEYDDAVLALDRFIQLHPGSSDIAQAYYLKALSYYEQISDVERDQATTGLAQASLREVYMRFPNTSYANEARLKYDLTMDHLAGKEMTIGRYYLKRYEYVAAMNRFKTVIDKFQTSSHTPEALYRLIEIYITLRLNDEALKTGVILGYNFPNNKWYKDAHELLHRKGIAPDA